ncbi:MAG: LysM peptidoglycan-binding domain-containing protein [Christensenellaceae bacterium]|nr:LysM peptidoglycan-binding domain-containing protein [Christensenellaceae bacterium]
MFREGGKAPCRGAYYAIPDADFCSRQKEQPWPWGEEKTYKVRWGDTVYGIANRFGTTMAAITRRNGLSMGRLTAGMELIIPCLAPGFGVYSLQPGQTMDAVAAQLGAEADWLRSCNHITGEGYPGMQIVLPVDTGRGQIRKE